MGKYLEVKNIFHKKKVCYKAFLVLRVCEKEFIIKSSRLDIRAIVAWCLYDWGISAFPVIVTTFVIATYFTSQIAINPIIGTHQWGIAMTIAGIIIAILSPVCGAIADYNRRRKSWLFAFTLLMIVSSALLWFAKPESFAAHYMLITVILGTIAFNMCMVFYNAILIDIAPLNYVGRISGWGWGVGYLGGLAILMIALFGFMNTQPAWLNIKTDEHIRICGPLVAVWSLLFTWPLFFMVSEKSHKKMPIFQAIRYGMNDVISTFKMLLSEKNILIFLLAQMVYIDGLNSLFAFGGIYAAGTFHMGMKDVLLFGIVMNIFAGMGSILLAWVDDWIGPRSTILFSLSCLTLLGLSIVLTKSLTHFWILACFLSLFVGPVQSSSRSLMAHLVPKDKATELFGFYILSGKVSTFLGPWLLGVMTLHFNSQRAGMGSLLCFFIVGACILLFVRNKHSLGACK
ncbi:MAG: MFS transporter [Gammaproteobacteria bacterium]|nr:MFS transporter [Gammaproteobacteria bacterium]